MQEHHHFGYTIKKIKRIGNGGFGYVDEVKLYNSNGSPCPGTYARKTFYPSEIMRQSILDLVQIKERFNEEVRCQANCNSFNVVSIYMHSLDIKNPWFIMELAESDLARLINEKEMNLSQKISALEMIVLGVKYIHDKNLLHRDIKPQNILKFKNNLFKLSDFGLVKDLNRDNPLTAIANISMGTDGYKAPEIKSAGIYDQRTDIYALGVVIEQFTDGQLNDIVSKCTMYNPKDRYQSASEIYNDLKKYQELVNA